LAASATVYSFTLLGPFHCLLLLLSSAGLFSGHTFNLLLAQKKNPLYQTKVPVTLLLLVLSELPFQEMVNLPLALSVLFKLSIYQT
jgi:hypothetical protein